VKTTREQIESILDIGCQHAVSASLDSLLHRIVDVASTLTDAEAAGILLFDAEEQQLRFVAFTPDKDRLLDVSVSLEHSIAGSAFAAGEPVVVSDVANDPRYYEMAGDPFCYQACAILAVPLQHRNRKIGVLEVKNKLVNLPFGDQDVEILSLLASQATVAIENMRLYQAAQNELGERTIELKAALSQAGCLDQQLQLMTSERERLLADLKTFSSTVAHDIKGLLGTIFGYSELIIRNAEQAGLLTVSEWGSEVGVAVLKVGKIVDDLLLLTRTRR